MFFWRFYLFLISEMQFSFQRKKDQEGTKNQWAVFVWFGLLFINVSFFFKVPNSDIECLVPGVKLRVRFFCDIFGFLFLWCMETLWRHYQRIHEKRSLTRDLSKIRFVAHSRHCERERC